MNDQHEPSTDFLDHMEWLVRTAHRRGERFAAPVRATGPTMLGRLRVAAMVLFALVGGATAGVTVERLQQGPVTELLQRRAKLRLASAQSDLERGQAELERVRELVDMSMASDAELNAANDRLAELHFAQERYQLEAEETFATGREHDDALTAPLVDERDFVLERLQRTKKLLHGRVESKQRDYARLKQLAAAGLVASAELEAALFERRKDELALRELVKRIAIRMGFLKGTIPFDKVEAMAQVAQLEQQYEIARMRLDEATVQLDEVAVEVLSLNPEIAGGRERTEAWLEELRAGAEKLEAELRQRSVSYDHACRDREHIVREAKLARTELDLAHERLSEGLTDKQVEALWGFEKTRRR